MIDNITAMVAGVHHSARPTWKLKETLHFYQEVLGLKLIHCLAAKGWGPAGHPDFLHFFFDTGAGSTIAFFYYLGTECPEGMVQQDSHFYTATHTAWNCGSRAELLNWQKRLEAHNWPIMFIVPHEVVESIYVKDPNGYLIEIGYPVRPFEEVDATDAALTLAATVALEDEGQCGAMFGSDIQAVWQRKGAMISQGSGLPEGEAAIYVVDLPEFSSVVTAAKKQGCIVSGPTDGRWTIRSERAIRFNRKDIGLTAALWNTALAGGISGHLSAFDRDDIVIEPRAPATAALMSAEL